MPLRRFLLAGAVLFAGAPACTTNQSGDLATSKTGDLAYPLAERRAPDEELVAACGDGALLADAEAIDRTPYLQRMSATGTRVLWTAGTSGATSVEVRRPDGDPAAAREAPAAAMVDGAASATSAAYESSVDGLAPDQIYCYSLVAGDAAITAPAGFRTAPAPDSGAPMSFVAFGDSGSGNSDQFAILDQLGTVPFRLMIHTGDIAYESGTLGEFEDNFFAVYAPLIKSFAMFPSIGNHDDSSVFRRVFDLPRAGEHNWYSFDYGDIHFVALDTNNVDAEQEDWLRADLAATDREWIVVFGHHPPYSSGEHGSSTGLRAKLDAIFQEHPVDLVLSGHDHDYERMEPQGGVHYVVTGGGGRGTRPVGSSSFTAFSEQVLNFVYVEVQDGRLVLHAIDAEGTEFDQLLIEH
jgi:acid phosphatase type 7